MKTTIKKITDRIQSLFRKSVDEPEDTVVETLMTGYNVLNPETGKYDQEYIDKDYSKFRLLLKDLYYGVLHEDCNWHFFLEGQYNILRFSSRFYARVEKILEENNVIYVHEGKNDRQMFVRPWVDEQEATRLHQKHFMKIFHEYSVMAITIDNYTTHKLTMLADRVIHCFFNHQFVNFQKELDKNCNLESEITSHLAVSRGFYVGTIVAHKRAYEKAREDMSKEYEERIKEMRATLNNIEKVSDVNAKELEDLRSRVIDLGVDLGERVVQ